MNTLINNEAILLNEEILWAEKSLRFAETQLSNYFFVIRRQYEMYESCGSQVDSGLRKTFYLRLIELNRDIEETKAALATLPTFTNL
jgi:hypothetical protein